MLKDRFGVFLSREEEERGEHIPFNEKEDNYGPSGSTPAFSDEEEEIKPEDESCAPILEKMEREEVLPINPITKVNIQSMEIMQPVRPLVNQIPSPPVPVIDIDGPSAEPLIPH